MGLALFEKYSSTSSPSDSKGRFPPISVDLFPPQVLTILKKYIVDNGYYNSLVNEEYLDIYAERRGFEHSFQIVRADNRTLISISVFGERKRGKTRNQLKIVYQELLQVFNR